MRMNRHRFLFIFIPTVAFASFTQAQTLDVPVVEPSFLAVTQFGMPRDSTFVFCESQDCPTHSIKHLAISPSL
jgi:hypothetical protein